MFEGDEQDDGQYQIGQREAYVLIDLFRAVPWERESLPDYLLCGLNGRRRGSSGKLIDS